MRLMISESKNSKSLYAIKSTFENGKHPSKIVEKLGTVQELERKLDGQSPIQWGKDTCYESYKKMARNGLSFVPLQVAL